MKDLYCDECSNKLEVNYDPIVETVYVKPCMVCVDKYIVESSWNIKAVKASLTALNEIYKILNKGEKK